LKEARQLFFVLPLTSAVLQLQKNVTCYFITEPNQTFPRTRTEPNPNSESSFPSLMQGSQNFISTSRVPFKTPVT